MALGSSFVLMHHAMDMALPRELPIEPHGYGMKIVV
jgi:hypothetical protein